MFEADRDGFPILPSIEEGESGAHRSRLIKALVYKTKMGKVTKLSQEDEKGAARLRYESLTNDNDTFELMRAGITPILVKEDDATIDVHLSGSGKLDESLRLGVHWMNDSGRLYLSIEGWLGSNPEQGFGIMLYKGRDEEYGFDQNQLDALKSCADRK